MIQLPADSVPVFMKEPPLPGTPLVAKDPAAAADHVSRIPSNVTAIMVSTVLNKILLE